MIFPSLVFLVYANATLLMISTWKWMVLQKTELLIMYDQDLVMINYIDDILMRTAKQNESFISGFCVMFLWHSHEYTRLDKWLNDLNCFRLLYSRFDKWSMIKVTFWLCAEPSGLTLHCHCARMMVPNRGTFHKMFSEFSWTNLSAIVKIRAVVFSMIFWGIVKKVYF